MRLLPRDRPRRLAVRDGVILPVVTPDQSVGAMGVFKTGPPDFSAEQCAQLMLLAETAVVRAMAVRIRERAEAVITTKVNERVAREIHDGPLQLLSGIMLHLRLARRVADAKLDESLLGLEEQMGKAIKQLRTLIRNVRSAHPEASLKDQVREALVRLEQMHGLSWWLRWCEPEVNLQRDVADEVFHVINEALTNSYRHSSAKHVSVTARTHGGQFEVTVRDDGVGFDVPEALRMGSRRLSFGLVSMQERVMTLGGTLALRSHPGQGTNVVIRVPLAHREVSKGA